ncbi:single-stranded DNA-binding protein [Tunturiibacter psychrotolerans]|uniref:single-stranded DNA-binding protein n=1 Tax=Tunturiibacter psychrotolerans TaxID=3069686 RepID=UPI003D21804E
MTLFENNLMLRGFLTRDVEVHSSNGITEDAFAVLSLATMSGTWNVATNEWTSRITSHRVVCPGPWFCGFTRGMRRGDYVEVEGELYVHDYERPVVVEGERFTAKRCVGEVRALQVRKLERPLVVIDTGVDD